MRCRGTFLSSLSCGFQLFISLHCDYTIFVKLYYIFPVKFTDVRSFFNSHFYNYFCEIFILAYSLLSSFPIFNKMTILNFFAAKLKQYLHKCKKYSNFAG